MESTEPVAPGPPRRLLRSRTNRWIAGVSGGLADYLGTDATLIRLGFVALTIMGGFGAPLYVLAWVIIPAEGDPESIGERWIAAINKRPAPPTDTQSGSTDG